MGESVTQMLRCDSSPRIGRRIDVHVVIPHEVREAVKQHSLVEDLVEGCA